MHRAALVALALALVAPVGAQAQGGDEWGITRDPEERRTRRSPRRDAASAARRSRGASSAPGTSGAPEADASDAALRERYERIVLSDPRDGFAMDRLLALHRATDGSLEGLEAAMRARLVTAPDERGALMVLARIARESTRLDEARALYEEVLAAHEGDPLAHAGLASVALAIGAPDEARTHLVAALERSDEADREERARALAEVLFVLEDWDAVERLYGELASGSRGAFLRTELARELAARGEHERAIAALGRVEGAIAGDRRALPPVLVLRARSEIALGRAADAISTLERARELTTASAGVRGEIAEVLLEAHRRDDRLADLARELEAHGSGFTDRMTLARALDELGRDEEAATAYARASALAPRDPEPRTRGIRVLLRAGRIEDAIEVAEGLVGHAPSDPHYVTELAELHASAGDRDGALAVLEAAARRAPREVALHQALAELYARWDEPARAEHELEVLARLEPDDPSHRVALGDQRLSEGDRSGALEAFRAVLDAVPDAADGHALLGGIYADHDLLTDAIAELDAAVALAPENLAHARELARALERADLSVRAEEAWQRVLALSSDDPLSAREAREHVVGLWARGRSGAARAAELRSAFEAPEPDVEAGRFLVEVLRRRSEIPAAIAVLRRVVELAPADVPSLLLLERLLVSEGDRAGAIDALRALAEADRPSAANYHLRMSEHAAALYRDADALAYARRATELAPGGAAAFARLGALLRSAGDVEGARRALSRARELDVRADETALALAELELEAGQAAHALEIVRDVIARSPDDESIARALRVSNALGDEANVVIRDALLSAALDAPDRVAVRRLAIDAWSRATSRLRAVVLADRATEDERVELRRLVTRALGPILAALTGGDEADRRAALALVAPAEVEAAVPALLALAASSAPIDLRFDALVGAGRAATAAHQARLVELAGAGNDLALRVAAVWALGRLGAPAQASLLVALQDAEPVVRGLSALGLGRLAAALPTRGRAAVGDALAAALASEAQVGAAGCIALALTWAAPHRVAPYLAAPDRLRGADARARSLFAAALASSTDPVAHAAVARALARGEAREAIFSALRRGAVDPLAGTPRRGEAAAGYALRSLELAPAGALELSALAGELERAFAEALAGDEERAAAALGAFAPMWGGWSWPAARAAGEERGPEVGPAVVAALAPAVVQWAEQGTGELRAAALALAAASAAPEAALVLAEVLGGSEAPLARVVLGAIDVRAAPTLAQAVAGALATSDDWGVRALAAHALTGVEVSPAPEALAAALASDPYALVRDAAAAALEPLAPTSDVAASALCAAAASDEEAAVRARATAALGGLSCSP